MSKAILVIYVPEEYSEQLDRLSVDYSLFYHDENGTVKQVDVEGRCPLKDLPEYNNLHNPYFDEAEKAFEKGFEECVRQITKGV